MNGLKASSMHAQEHAETEERPPFLDLDSVENGGLVRPWKLFWPPLKGGKVWDWLTLTNPDALEWRYNAQNPVIDRPWRQWTRQTNQWAKMEAQTAGKSSNLNQTNFIPLVPLTPDIAGFEHTANKAVHRDHPQEAASTVTTVTDRTTGHGGSVHIQAALRHLVPLRMYEIEKPYLSRLPHIEGFKRTNIIDQDYIVTLSNIRGNEHEFSLDTAGFEYRHLPCTLSAWNDEVVIQQYLPFVQKWLARSFSCDDVVIYAFNFRAATETPQGDSPWKPPFFRAHCDATSRSCARRLQLLNKADEASKTRRIRFVNVWRPITGPFQDSPLAMCDARTLSPGDLVPADVVFPHYCDEGFEVLRRNSHRWVYKNPMGCDEVIIFKLDDTDSSVAKCCPHSAFQDPTVPYDTPSRASIEVRAIIIGG